MSRLFLTITLGIIAMLPGTFVSAQTTPPADAQQPGHTATADGRHTLNLKDADIQALIATVSEITGKNFIVGAERAGQGHGDLGAADEAGRNLRRVPVGAARARLRRGAVRQHDQDRAGSDGAAGWLGHGGRSGRIVAGRTGHPDRAGQARLRGGTGADPASADAAGWAADCACRVQLAGRVRPRRQRQASRRTSSGASTPCPMRRSR